MTETVSAKNPLGTERIEKLMIRFAIPSIISIVVNSLYNMVDQIFIGWGVGYLGNAATNVIFPMTMLLMAISMMIGDGAAAFMSLNLGKKEPEVAAYGVGNAITLAAIVGVLFSTVCQIFLEPLCRFFGATAESLPYALEYGRIIVLGFPAATVCSGFGSILRADARPKTSMAGLMIGCISNIILDPIFIFGLDLGVAGAAWATLAGQVLNALCYIVCMFQFKTIRLRKKDFILLPKVVKKVLMLGISSFCSQAASVIMITVMNNTLVKYGAMSVYGEDIPMAVMGIVMKVSQLITGVILGIASGVQPIFGYNYGSQQYGRVKQTLKLSLGISTAIGLVALFVFQVFPEQLISLFGQESDLYVSFAVKTFRTYLLGCFMIPCSCVIGIFYQSIGKAARATVLTLLRQVVLLIPSILIFAYLGGVEGVLWAGPVADGCAGIIALITLFFSWNKIFHA